MGEPEQFIAITKMHCQSMLKLWKNDHYEYQYQMAAGWFVKDEKDNEIDWPFLPNGNIVLTSIRDELFEVGKDYEILFRQEVK